MKYVLNTCKRNFALLPKLYTVKNLRRPVRFSSTHCSYRCCICAPCPLYSLYSRLSGSQKLSAIEHHSTTLTTTADINPLNPELNPICYLLALLGAHHFLHVSRIRVKLLTSRLLMSYIYGATILDVSRSHTTTQHSR